MGIDFKHPQTILAIILIIAALVGPIFFRERMLWKLDETQHQVLADIKDLKFRMNEAEKTLRERKFLYNYWMRSLGKEALEEAKKHNEGVPYDTE